jgi:hypothetical protein
MLKAIVLIGALFFGALAVAQHVSVSSPLAGTTVADPFSVNAACNAAGADAMQVYMDSTLVYSAQAPSMNAYISAGAGNHEIEVKCWANTTYYSSGTYSITVAREAGTDQVPVASPFLNATVGSPFTVIAGCNVADADALQIYMDSTLVYSGNPASGDYNLSASPGGHHLEVKCWAGGTAYSSGLFGITVANSGASPVVVSSPLANSTVGTRFSAIASCNVPGGADAMQIYMDSTLVFNANVTTLNANVTASLGNHQIEMKCWKKGVAYSSGTYPFSAGPEAGTSQVVVSSPLPGTTEASAFNVTANCNIAGADAIDVYLDSSLVYSPKATAINYLAKASPASSHRVEVKCWAGGTAYSSGTYVIDPADTSGSGFDGSPNIPIPPSFSYYVDNIQNLANWSSATGAVAACPNGMASSACNPPKANYDSTVQQVADPAPLAGSDDVAGLFQLYNGPAWADVIWVKNLLTGSNASHFIWDVNLYVDSTNYNGSELDLYTTGNNGQAFMMGSLCNRPGNSLDTWNNATQQWIHNKSIPCNDLLTANSWHRITYYTTSDLPSDTYKYHVVRIDGVDYVLNQTQSAGGSGWPNGNVGFQVQLDSNASGAGVDEYLESVQLYAW